MSLPFIFSYHLYPYCATVHQEKNQLTHPLFPILSGIFPSEMTGGESDENQKTKLDPGSSNPAGRKGVDSDMAATILMLAGRGGTFYNHQIMYPDGGNTLSQPSVV